VAQLSDCQTVKSSVLLGAQLDLGEQRRPVAGDLQLHGAIQKQLYGAPAAVLGQPRAELAPAVVPELAAEASAHGLHLRVNVGGGNLDTFARVAAHSEMFCVEGQYSNRSPFHSITCPCASIQQ